MKMDYNLAIAVMASISFCVRYAFFSHTVPIKINHRMGKLLLFTAPCVLVAMIIPIMFKDYLSQSQNIASTLNNNYFLASVVTIIISFIIRNSLAIIVLGMLSFYLLKFY